MEAAFESIRKKFGIGEYPPQYNPKIHGPYYPSRYYGTPDTKFTELKVSEVPKWFSRRNYDPESVGRGLSRAVWRYQMKWLLPKKASAACVVHICLGLSLFYFISSYPHYRSMGHHHCKYHW